MRRAAGSTRSRRAAARSPGRPASRSRARDAAGAVKSWTAPTTRARALLSCRRAIASRSPITMASRCGFPTPPPSRRCSNGRARISTSTVSPDGRFLVTSMQENALHGWRARRLAQHAHDRLSRQDALDVVVARRPLARDLGRRRLRRLAVQGQGRADGQGAARMRRAPAAHDARSPFIRARWSSRIGYADGLMLLCRLGDGAEILVRNPRPRRARSARSPGTTAARDCCSASKAGAAGLLTLPA